MTPAQAEWLRKLRDDGAPCVDALWDGFALEKLGYIRAVDAENRDFITPAGLAALAAYEEKGE
jgi:hypothetical protein